MRTHFLLLGRSKIRLRRHRGSDFSRDLKCYLLSAEKAMIKVVGGIFELIFCLFWFPEM
jgi:hypothetical protein